MTEHLLHGYLVIYIDGYKYCYKGLTHFIEQDGKHYAIPDKLMPAPVKDIDSMKWWEEGWAVGENTQTCWQRCARRAVTMFLHQYQNRLGIG